MAPGDRVFSADERRLQLFVAAACMIPALLWILQGYASAKLNGRATTWGDVMFNAGDWLGLAPLALIPFRIGWRFPLTQPRWKSSIAVHLAGALAFSLCWASIAMLADFVRVHRGAIVNLHHVSKVHDTDLVLRDGARVRVSRRRRRALEEALRRFAR